MLHTQPRSHPQPLVRSLPLGYFAAVSAALRCRAERRWSDQFWLFKKRPSTPLGSAVVSGGGGGGGDGVGASVHHASVETVGHGKGLEVGLEGEGQGQLVHKVDRRAGDNGAAAEVLKTQH